MELPKSESIYGGIGIPILPKEVWANIFCF